MNGIQGETKIKSNIYIEIVIRDVRLYCELDGAKGRLGGHLLQTLRTIAVKSHLLLLFHTFKSSSPQKDWSIRPKELGTQHHCRWFGQKRMIEGATLVDAEKLE